MSFASPWLLLGLLGLGIPVAAHLLGRREPRVIPFAATRFLTPAQPQVARRTQLRDRGLLAARVLLWLLLVLALARPFTPRAAELSVYGAPHDAVLLVDTSASMQLRRDGRRRIDDALDRARELLDALPAGSRLAIVTSDARAWSTPLDAPARAKVDDLEDWLDGHLSAHGRPLADGLDAAVALLGPDEGRPRVLYALSDATTTGLGSLPPSAGPDIATYPLAIDEGESPPAHVGLDALRWSAARELDPRAIRVQGRVKAHGTREALTVEVGLEIDGELAARTQVELPPSGEAEVEFTHTLLGDADAARAALVLDLPDDPYPADDRREFWIDSDAELHVVVVNGDPSDRREFDEVFFLNTAIRAADPEGRLTVRGLAPDQLERDLRDDADGADAPLRDTDVLVLANVPAPSPELAAALRQAVDRGMGLWISVGDRVATQAYNEAFDELLPLRLRGASFAGTAPGRAAARVEGLAPVHLAHPLFRGLVDGVDLGSTRTRRLFLLEPDAARDVDIALSFASGAPALLSHGFGRGRVALLTTTLDRDWSDLALRPGFVPLVEGLLRWLAGRDRSAAGAIYWVGAPVDLPGAQSWLVRRPDGVEVPAGTGAPNDPERDGGARFQATERPGLYEARPPADGDGPSVTRRFAVQSDPAESRTDPVAIPEVEADGSLPVEGRNPRWRELLALVVLLLALESWLRVRAARPADPAS